MFPLLRWSPYFISTKKTFTGTSQVPYQYQYLDQKSARYKILDNLLRIFEKYYVCGVF